MTKSIFPLYNVHSPPLSLFCDMILFIQASTQAVQSDKHQIPNFVAWKSDLQ